jgi:hypothetical protein
VKQRDHCIFPLSSKQLHICEGEIHVFLDDPTRNCKRVSNCARSKARTTRQIKHCQLDLRDMECTE